jgi:hypothetical protein
MTNKEHSGSRAAPVEGAGGSCYIRPENFEIFKSIREKEQPFITVSCPNISLVNKLKLIYAAKKANLNPAKSYKKRRKNSLFKR